MTMLEERNNWRMNVLYISKSTCLLLAAARLKKIILRIFFMLENLLGLHDLMEYLLQNYVAQASWRAEKPGEKTGAHSREDIHCGSHILNKSALSTHAVQYRVSHEGGWKLSEITVGKVRQREKSHKKGAETNMTVFYNGMGVGEANWEV